MSGRCTSAGYHVLVIARQNGCWPGLRLKLDSSVAWLEADFLFERGGSRRAFGRKCLSIAGCSLGI